MKISIDRFSEIMQEIAKDNPIEAYDYLEEGISAVVDELNREVVLEAIRRRKKWQQIKVEYYELEEFVGGVEAIRQLSEKWNYSERNIKAIVYEK